MAIPMTSRTADSLIDPHASAKESSENIKKMDEEIDYVKKLKAFVDKKILPKIEMKLNKKGPRLDEFAHNDFEGLRQRIFTCIATIDPIIERYNKYTDHVDLLLDQISRENQTFTDVLYNGTARGRHVRTNIKRLVFDNNDLGPDACVDHAMATTYRWGREP